MTATVSTRCHLLLRHVRLLAEGVHIDGVELLAVLGAEEKGVTHLNAFVAGYLALTMRPLLSLFVVGAALLEL